MHRKLLALTTALVTIPGLALAAPPGGFYGGLSAGYHMGDGTLTIPAYAPPTYSIDLNGVGVGAFAGFNFPGSGGLVFGIEVGANLLNTSDSVGTAIPGETFMIEGNWEASIVARAGSTVGQVFVYGLGGASIMEVSGQYSGGFPSQSNSQVGWTVGLGAERETANGGFVRGELRYAEYPTFDLQCTACGPTNFDLSDLTISVGVGFDF